MENIKFSHHDSSLLQFRLSIFQTLHFLLVLYYILSQMTISKFSFASTSSISLPYSTFPLGKEVYPFKCVYFKNPFWAFKSIILSFDLNFQHTIYHYFVILLLHYMNSYLFLSFRERWIAGKAKLNKKKVDTNYQIANTFLILIKNFEATQNFISFSTQLLSKAISYNYHCHRSCQCS